MAKEGRIPNGYYDAIPVPVETEDGKKFCQLGLSKRSGTKQVMVTFQIDSGEFKGVKLPWFGYLTKDAAETTIKSLKLIGWNGKSFKDLTSLELTGKVQITVENDTYEGRVRSRVSWVNELGGPQIILGRILPPKEVSSLDKEFAQFLE